ncbi:MAG: hypothetical protein SWH54_00440 [Thermodesulfobacteriota bacterium]|nr:hypothetical protein [Thermodesulfobacteriota bacterium]
MKHRLEFDFYETKDDRKYAFFYNLDGNVAWAVGFPPPLIPKLGVGKAGPEVKADSQEDARQKLIKAIESGNYLNEP